MTRLLIIRTKRKKRIENGIDATIVRVIAHERKLVERIAKM